MSSFTDTNYSKDPSCLTRQSLWFSEHRDLQATAMSVDWSGQNVLLAGRCHLALQSLVDPADGGEGTLRKFNRHSKYEVTAAEWAICQHSQEYCAIATSQSIEVVTWRSGDPTLMHSLRAHTRVITDIDWHSKQPHLLASCSVDTFTHLWDLRDPRKPMLSLSAVCMSGASQVGFNRVSGNLLATAHDGDLRIWDQRRGACPIQYITAHSARIHGINWSHRSETALTTSSQDGTVKYFDIKHPQRAERIITNSSPVWRARYTPFADGLVTVIVSYLGRGENSLLLWNNGTQSTPVCQFVGHTDVVLDFAWRPTTGRRAAEASATASTPASAAAEAAETAAPPVDMELVTWSRDQTVRVWAVDETLRRLCEPEPDDDDDEAPVEAMETPPTTEAATERLPLQLPESPHIHHAASAVRSSSRPRSGAGAVAASVASSATAAGDAAASSSSTSTASCTLQHEFSLLNTNIPHIDVEVLDPIKRSATVRCSVNGHVIMLQAQFPAEYPRAGHPPEFAYCQGTTLTAAPELCEQLMRAMCEAAEERVRRGRSCLEQCLRELVAGLKKATSSGDRGAYQRLQSPRLEGALSGALHDACVPFPRTSGARFGAVGLLVMFAQPLSAKQQQLKLQYQQQQQHQALQHQPHHQQQHPQRLSGGGGSGGTTAAPAQSPVATAAVLANMTPRSMSALNGGYLGSVLIAGSAASAAGASKPNKRSAAAAAAARQAKAAPVLVYDLTRYVHVSAELAEHYVIDSLNAVQMCRHNREVAQRFGCEQVAESWSLAELMATAVAEVVERHQGDEAALQQMPFARSVVERLIMHYAECRDLQTAAMLCCAFGRHCPPGELMSRSSSVSSKSMAHSPSGSPYHTIMPVDSRNSKQVTLAAQLKHLRSNSWSDSLDECRVAGFDFNRTLLGDSQRHLYDHYKRAYAEMLFRWRLLVPRAKVLKYLSASREPPRGVEFVTECAGCTRPAQAAACRDCRRRLLHCGVCRTAVDGSANGCVRCGHGGHSEHMHRWFGMNDSCASGCGCQCLKLTGQLVEM